MKNKNILFAFGLFLGIVFSACSASNEEVPINIPSEDDDVCCSQDDENNIKLILAGLKEVTGLSRQSVEGYTLKVYARTANLHVGYNDLYFAVEKTESGRHIKDFEVTALSPLMDMGMMVHSTPIADKYDLDVKQIVLDKLRRNAEKYPVDKAYGSAKKYNEL